jgi:myo-inositol-1(or 4)-monophosphatase
MLGKYSKFASAGDKATVRQAIQPDAPDASPTEPSEGDETTA